MLKIYHLKANETKKKKKKKKIGTFNIRDPNHLVQQNNNNNNSFHLLACLLIDSSIRVKKKNSELVKPS